MILRLMMIQRYHNMLLILFTILLFLLCNFQNNRMVFVFASNNNNFNNSPYHILGVNEKLCPTQEEISKQYRKLCLKYHPDKNTNKSKKERDYCENKFKSIQHAYELIGTPEARSKYRYTTASSSSFHHHRYQQQHHRHHPDPIIDAFFQAYRQGQRFGGSNNGLGGFHFYTFRNQGGGGGIGRRPSPFFNNNNPKERPSSPFFDQHGNNNNNQFKSIYIEKISIPLEVLYEGADNYEFILKDKWWKRWRAAIHGKFIYISIYQGLMYALPILKASKILAVIAAGLIIHATLPNPSDENNTDSVDDELSTNYYIYKQSIRKGTKGSNKYENNNNNNGGNDESNNGQTNNSNNNNNNSPKTTTRIKFQSKKSGGFGGGFNTPDIIFEIYEQDHPLYHRIGDNLHTTIELTSKEYRHGCIKYVPHIISCNNKNNKNNKGGGDGGGYDPIEIHIPPTTTTTTTTSKAKRRDDQKKKTKSTTTPSSSSTTTNYDNNNTLVIKGKGWPIRNNSYGDLIVHIKVVDDDIRSNKKKKKRKGKYKKKKK